MKNKALFFLLMFFSLTLLSCSTDDGGLKGGEENNSISHKIIGKWYFEDPTTNGTSINNFFIFNSKNEVTYNYWVGTGIEFDVEKGNYKFEGDIMTMTFPDGVEYKFVQKVVFLSDTKVKFETVPGSKIEAYEGTYYLSK